MAQERAREECDLVMKGGITSGIVYPPLISVLKDKYFFRSIGGTSAGAIAAAATAAAEFGREADGFAKLDQLTHEIADGTFLLHLFQPSRRTRPLFNVLLSLTQLTKQKTRLLGVRLVFGITWALLREVTTAFFTGACLGVGVTFLFTWLMQGAVQGLGIGVTLFTAWLGALAAGMIRLVLILLKEVPQNFLGMCTGRHEEITGAETQVLTDWLDQKLDDMAGITNDPARHQSGYRPLTFGDLQQKPFGDERDEAPPGTREEHITLRMVTSNLSQNQPYILPFRERLFLFNRDEFAKFFPQRVVAYLVDYAQRNEGPYTLPPDYYFLPEADALPVIVATRLSLSFPVLLSAVPLYAIKPHRMLAVQVGDSGNAVGVDDLHRHWFSDGGICSNFPIQFFDGWLPTRPTFGVNLTSLPAQEMTPDMSQVQWEGLSPTSSAVTPPNVAAIYLPKPDESPVTEYISFEQASPGNGSRRAPDLFRFLWAIFSTAQNYRDNAQSVLPSYRERIVQIRLRDDEGGLNLTMPGETIAHIIHKGKDAGEKLRDEFDFEAHQWIRFRVLMKRMEESLVRMNTVMRAHPFYRRLLEPASPQPNYPYYPQQENWAALVATRLTQVGKDIEGFTPPDLFAAEPSPLPEPVLRVTPEV
jgi:predicted acylesterase/phospholipase RssA